MANYKIRQEINFTNRIISADSSAIISVDAADYNGATFYFEVVAKVASDTLTVGCWDVALGSNKTTVSVTATSYTVYRSASFTPTAGEREYIVDVSGGTTPLIKSARIVILQDAATITDTVAQIEMGDYETNTATPEEDPTLFPIAEPKYWLYESAKWDPTPTFSFGYTAVCENDMGDVTIGLEADDGSYNWTGSFVTDSENLFADDESIAYYENGPITLTNGLHYRVAVMVENDAYGFDLFNAKIIATQTDATLITKLQIEYLMINEGQSTTGNKNYLNSWDTSEWNDEGGSLTYYHEQSTTNAADNTKLEYDLDGTPTLVTNSSITGANLTRSSALTMPSTDTLDTDIVVSTGTIYGDRILTDVYLTAAGGAVAPTSVIYGPLMGPLGGPI